MLLNLVGEISELNAGIAEIGRELRVEMSVDGTVIEIEKSVTRQGVSLSNDRWHIQYTEKAYFFRAFGLVVDAIRRRHSLERYESPQFRTMGLMLDCSRNAVPTMGSLKKFLRIMALMGFNMLMLYMEDTYEVVGEPYFGYMRGKYKTSELKEIDDYADSLGIEMVPCIQTLGHLRMVLRWKEYEHLRDNDQVILVGSPQTYELIDRMIRSASTPFRSKRIHIGMDEAWGLGHGNFYKQNGYHHPFETFIKHLNIVVEIAERHGLRPMIWSDMFFRVASPTHEYYDLDTQIPDDIVNQIPKQVQLVFWDYYHRQENVYRSFLARHKTFGSMPVFAGGILCWGTFGTQYQRTFVNTEAALRACKQEGIQEVFATVWLDDGAENHHFSALLGMQLYAEHRFADSIHPEFLKRRVEMCTGIGLDAFMDLSYLDQVPGINSKSHWPANVSKYVMWQDPLLGTFDDDIADLNLPRHYEHLEDLFAAHEEENAMSKLVVEIPRTLCRVLSLKSSIAVRLRDGYLRHDHEELARLAQTELPELHRRVNDLRVVHRSRWMELYKPFGWETLELRYGGLMARIESAIHRLNGYLNGEVDRLEELDEARHPLDRGSDGIGIGFWKWYRDIAILGNE